MITNKLSQYLHHQQAPEILIRFPRLLFMYYWFNRIMVLRTWYVRRIFRKILASNPSPRNILDVGCGMGDFMFSIPELRPTDSVTGIDLSFSNIQLCKQLAESLGKNNYSFFQDNLSESAFPDQQDIILCSAVLMYIEDDVALLKKFRNSLSEKGKLILYVPVNYRRFLSFYKNLSKKNGFDYDEMIGRPHTYTDESIVQRIHAAGFVIEEQQYSFGRLASIMFEISALFEWYFKTQHVLFSIPLFPLYFVFLPINMISMGIDYIGKRTTGNGCIIVAKKITPHEKNKSDNTNSRR